jgi:hypothetical protein
MTDGSIHQGKARELRKAQLTQQSKENSIAVP